MNLIDINQVQSVAIRNEAARAGETHIELLASEGQGDRKIEVYYLPKTGVRVIATNGDPIWEEASPQGFADTLEEYGISI